MLVSFLLAYLPASLMLIGGIIAAAGGLHIAVSVPGTRAPSDKGGVAVALGLALVLVMAGWNTVLNSGFKALGIDPETATTVQESGDVFGDIAIAGQIAMITLGAVAALTLIFAIIIGVAQRAIVAGAAPAALASVQAMHTRPGYGTHDVSEPPAR